MHLIDFLLPPSLWLAAASASPVQQEHWQLSQVPQAHDSPISPQHHAAAPKKLQGQFIHITDIHPDPWYIPKGRVSTSCHRKKPKKEKDRGGFWGAPRSETCDSPLSLVNLTMQWLEEEWADKVDFVIWTGDSARHDNDHQLPRTESEIFDLNRQTVSKMEDVFTKRKVPIVVSLGNNDMYPHNIMYPGPNQVTHEYLNIWKSFIPFPSYQVFQRGAYYSVEVVPNHLAAISLNTLYWYDSNKAVDGCPKNKKSDDPGRLELDWLEVQLNLFRKRKMQVWLTGHVPPTMGNYYPECYLGYAQLALRFQDTIVGHLFGHMNVDHFFWIDAHELHSPPKPLLAQLFSYLPTPFSSLRSLFSSFTDVDDQPSYAATKKKRWSLPKTLRQDFRALPPHKNPPNETGVKINYDDYVIVNVGPSVVPAYLPSVRVFRYNVTQWDGGKVVGDEDMKVDLGQEDEEDEDDDDEDEDEDDDEEAKHDKKKGSKRHHGHRHDRDGIDCTLKKNRDKKQCTLKGPRHASKHSPSRTNRMWSPLGYTQWYLPGIDDADVFMNESNPPKYQMEYMTYPLASLSPPTDWPVPQTLLPEGLRNMTEVPEGMKSELAPYHLKDLTIPSWIKLARRLGNKKKLWKRFESFMYLGGEED